MAGDTTKPMLNVLITAGGTVAPIDDVRLISNRSTGRFGSKLAEAWLESGAEVAYLATTPQTLGPLEIPRVSFDLELNPHDIRGQVVEQTIRRWNFASHCRRIVLQKGNVADYAESLEKIAKSKNWQVVMLAAAVSDYEPVALAGKISSDAEEISLQLKRTPKVIQSVREWVGPDCMIVGFKLTSGASDEEMIQIATAACRKNQADFTLVNDQRNINEGRHRVALVTSTGTADWFEPGEDMSDRIVRFLLDKKWLGPS